MESSLIFQWPVGGQNCHPEFTPHPSSPWNVALAVLDSGYDHESALPLHGLGELSLRSWKSAGALLVSDTFDWCRVEVCTYMKHEKMKKNRWRGSCTLHQFYTSLIATWLDIPSFKSVLDLWWLSKLSHTQLFNFKKLADEVDGSGKMQYSPDFARIV